MADLLKVRGLRLVPLNRSHLKEILVTQEMINEARLLGYDSTQQLFEAMFVEDEAYAVLDGNDEVIVLTGLVHDQDMSGPPQMFAMFSAKAKEKKFSVLRASQRLVDHYHRFHPCLQMGVHKSFPFMIQFATWLGFEPRAIDDDGFIIFVRCNDEGLELEAKHRPTKH